MDVRTRILIPHNGRAYHTLAYTHAVTFVNGPNTSVFVRTARDNRLQQKKIYIYIYIIIVSYFVASIFYLDDFTETSERPPINLLSLYIIVRPSCVNTYIVMNFVIKKLLLYDLGRKMNYWMCVYTHAVYTAVYFSRRGTICMISTRQRHNKQENGIRNYRCLYIKFIRGERLYTNPWNWIIWFDNDINIG